MNKRKVQSVIFYCDASNKKHFLLLLVNQERGLFWQNSTGGVEENESFKEAAVREAKEETNITDDLIQNITETDIFFEFHDRWGCDVYEKVFFIRAKRPWDILLDPSEHVEYKWIEDKDLSEDTVLFESNLQALLECKELK